MQPSESRRTVITASSSASTGLAQQIPTTLPRRRGKGLHPHSTERKTKALPKPPRAGIACIHHCDQRIRRLRCWTKELGQSSNEKYIVREGIWTEQESRVQMEMEGIRRAQSE